MNTLPEIMGTGDVMEYLGVSKQRVYELIERGQLKPRKTSAGIIFLKDDVVAYKRKRDLWKRKRTKPKSA